MDIIWCVNLSDINLQKLKSQTIKEDSSIINDLTHLQYFFENIFEFQLGKGSIGLVHWES